jgi:hypothetical protein
MNKKDDDEMLTRADYVRRCFREIEAALKKKLITPTEAGRLKAVIMELE